MAPLNLLSPNIPNFHNFALFICHLFIDGRFRTGHILQDPNIFDDRLIIEIDSVCPRSIPWLTNDVTQLSSLPWDQNNRTDHILQLIFIDPGKLPDNLNDLKNRITYYHLFVMNSNAHKDQDECISLFEKLKEIVSPKSIILNHSVDDGSISLHSISGSVQVFLSTENVFDYTFGKLKQKEYLVIGHITAHTCNNIKLQKIFQIWKGEIFVVNFFSGHLNASIVQLRTVNLCKNDEINYQWVHYKHHKYYREISTEHKPIEIENLNMLKNSSHDILTMNLKKFPSKNDSSLKITPLYPYKPKKLFIAFFYGDDFQRYTNNTVLFKLLFSSLWIYMGFCLVVAILFFIRRNQKLNYDGLISCAIDVVVSIVGGGKLHIEHKLEKWFFVIMSICGIFISAIGIPSVLFPIFVIHDRSIDTLEELVRINPPIYIGTSLNESRDIIAEMLRNQIGTNVHYEGVEEHAILKNHKSCFALIENEDVINMLKIISTDRDFDVLHENLGFLMSPYFLTGYKYVSEQTINQIDKMTSSLMESGLDRFYESFGEYLFNLYSGTTFDKAQNDVQPINREFIMAPLILYFRLLGVASIIFLTEIVSNHINKLRSRRRVHHSPNTPV